MIGNVLNLTALLKKMMFKSTEASYVAHQSIVNAFKCLRQLIQVYS